MKCKVCGEKRHYCSSCDYDPFLSEDYCDRQCFVKSDFYKKEKGEFLNLLDRLNEDGIRIFKVFLNNQHSILENDYINWCEEYLNERKHRPDAPAPQARN